MRIGAIGLALGLLLVGARWGAEPLRDKYPHSRIYRDRNHEVLRISLSGDEKLRLFRPLAQIPETVQTAFLQKEDQIFFWHPGINPWSVVRAIYRSYVVKSRFEGGSTITMQLARLLKPIDSRNFSGKLRQMLWALSFELQHSKNEILEAYLNKLPFGGNIEGIASAAWMFYGKDVAELTHEEIGVLVEIPQNPARAKELVRRRLPFRAPQFVNYLANQVDSESDIDSTLDWPTQQRLEQVLSSYRASFEPFGVQNAALVLIHWPSREVRAWIGSVDFFNERHSGQVDGVRSARSPGSTLKPILYALALEQGVIHPGTLLKDAPRAFGAFEPENFDQKFSGPLSATEALVRSRNLPAVSLASQVHDPDLYHLLQAGGLRFQFSENYYGPGLVLGGVETSLYQLAKWYTALANFGVLGDLKIRPRAASAPTQRWLSREASFLVLDMLIAQGDLAGASRSRWAQDGYPLAWKTGTSQRFRDAWTMGIVGDYVLGVWLGNFDGSSNSHLIGRDLAAPLFFRAVDALFAKDLSVPSDEAGRLAARLRYRQPLWRNAFGLNLKKVKICAVSGALPQSYCHLTTPTWFIPGRSPIHQCDIHRPVALSKKTGRRICQNGAGSSGEDVTTAIFEFWPSDLMRLFRQAGLPRTSPPEWDSRCADVEWSLGSGPTIQSPRLEVEYKVSESSAKPEPIALLASVDGDSHQLKWFIDREFVGASSADVPLFWQPKMGRHFVRVVDEQGRSDQRELTVNLAD